MYQRNRRSGSHSQSRKAPHQRHGKRKNWFVFGTMIVFLLAIVIGLLWLWPYHVMPEYVGPNGNEVLQVQFSSTKVPHLINVQLTFFNPDNKPSKFSNCYIMQGQNLTIQADKLDFAQWLSIIGLHSGYKLTQLDGCYTDATFQNKLTLSELNGGEDSFFAAVQGHPWYSQLVEAQAQYSKPIPVLANLPVGQKTETIYVYTTPQGLSVVDSK